MSVPAKCAANVRVGEYVDLDLVMYKVIEAKHNKKKGVMYLYMERLSDGKTKWFGFPEREVLEVTP